jgi:hypothetical protein
MTTIPENELLTAALIGYQAGLRMIDEKIQELRREIRGSGKVAVVSDGATPKRQMSAAAKARVVAAQKKRWAAFRKQKAPKAPAKKALAKKHKVSAAGRKAIAEAAKNRWAAYRVAKAKAA